MKTQLISLLSALLLCTNVHAATKCSRANLTRCLDSACAINISANRAARCQYCGTSSAGTPPSEKKGMKTISAGASAKYNISEKELKKAPTDPGERYAWATKLCISKVSGCTVDDVSDTYDKLIEQSCTAAGVSAKMDKTLDQASKKKSKTTCKTDITACMVADKHCTADYRNCSEESDFNKFFATCSVESTGCDDYVAEIRETLIAARDDSVSNTDSVLAKIIAAYQSARDKKLTSIKSGCKDNSARDACIETVCANNMPNKCGDGYESEKTAALDLCKFYDIACATID
ncbi:MAG: hypothetical protein II208_04250 [Alphaproteobacteria bacterium]|nr:hypothetical protein [Alphaproteobacteria bacterium]